MRAIWGIADDVENAINWEAETVGCNYEDKTVRRRYEAERQLDERVTGKT